MNSFDQLTLKDLLTVIYQKQEKDTPHEEITTVRQEETKDVPQASAKKPVTRNRKKEEILQEITHVSDKERKTRRVQLLMKESSYNALKVAADEMNTNVNALIGDIIDYLFKGQALYTRREIQKILKVSKGTALRYITSGKIKATKIDGWWMVTKEDLDAFLQTRDTAKKEGKKA